MAAVFSTGALAQEPACGAQPLVPVSKIDKSAPPKASKAIRLSDAELDKIVAGDAEVLNGGGITVVLNPGNAEILKFNKNHIVCINCF